MNIFEKPDSLISKNDEEILTPHFFGELFFRLKILLKLIIFFTIRKLILAKIEARGCEKIHHSTAVTFKIIFLQKIKSETKKKFL